MGISLVPSWAGQAKADSSSVTMQAPDWDATWQLTDVLLDFCLLLVPEADRKSLELEMLCASAALLSPFTAESRQHARPVAALHKVHIGLLSL